MKKVTFLFLFIIYVFGLANPSFSDDYQYTLFNGRDEYIPFADYIPTIKLHYYTVPHYLEDFYLLYGMKLYYNENSLRKNIAMLQTALKSAFRHPSSALVEISSENEYLKYRKLMFMHINIMIMRNHMKIGVRYDKKNIKFYNQEFSKEISESLEIARKIYSEAIPYWEEARRYAKEASRIKITTNLANIETERYRIMTGDLDFGKIIKKHINDLNTKQAKLNNYSASSK